MAIKANIPGYKRPEPTESTGVIDDLLHLLGLDQPLNAADLISPLGMAKIAPEALHAAINARRRLFHGTNPSKALRILTEGEIKPFARETLKRGEAPEVSLSRNPDVSSFFGDILLGVDPEKLPRKTKPFASKLAAGTEQEERISKVPVQSISEIIIRDRPRSLADLPKQQIDKLYEVMGPSLGANTTEGFIKAFDKLHASEKLGLHGQINPATLDRIQELREIASKLGIPVTEIKPLQTSTILARKGK